MNTLGKVLALLLASMLCRCLAPPPYHLELPCQIIRSGSVVRQNYPGGHCGEWLFYYDVAVSLAAQGQRLSSRCAAFLLEQVLAEPAFQDPWQKLPPLIQAQQLTHQRLADSALLQATQKSWTILAQSAFVTRWAALIVGELDRNSRALVAESPCTTDAIASRQKRLPTMATDLAQQEQRIQLLESAFQQLIKQNDELQAPLPEDIYQLIQEQKLLVGCQKRLGPLKPQK